MNSGRIRSIASSTLSSVGSPGPGEETRARAVVRSGYVAANAAAYGPPTDIPSTATRSMPQMSSSSAASRATLVCVDAVGVDEP